MLGTTRTAVTALVLVLVGACTKREPQAAANAGAQRAASSPDAGAARGQAGDISFEQACSEPSLRPAYVEQVVARAEIPAYVRIEYLDYAGLDALLRVVATGAAAPIRPAFLTIPDDPNDRSPAFAGGHRSHVLVLPAAFDRGQVGSEIVFLLGLLDHELVHARHAAFGLDMVPALCFWSLSPATAAWLYDTLSELEAYRSELAAARKYRLPASYYVTGWGRYLEYYLRLFDIGHDISPEIRAALLAAFFEDWMPKQARIFFRRGDLWYFSIEGRRYEFPPAVVERLTQRDAIRPTVPEWSGKGAQ